MSSENPYERVKAGRLAFKGGEALASGSKKIDKKKKRKNKKQQQQDSVNEEEEEGEQKPPGEVIYTIDAARKMKYEELFPVETRKFGYDPKAKVVSVEDALDDRIKKKADRYCK